MTDETPLNVFAQAVIRRDFAAAHALLAPWLRDSLSADRLGVILSSRVTEVASAVPVSGTPWPVSFRIERNSLTLPSLKSDTPDMPQDITDSNYAGWFCVEFLADPSSGIDAWFDLWCVLVTSPNRAHLIGYIEAMDAD